MLKNLLTKLDLKTNISWTKIKSLFYNYRFELLFLLITLAIHSALLNFSTQLAFGDLAPFPETWQQGITDFAYAWRDVAFGYYRHPGNITILLQSALIFILGSPLLAQKVYIFILLPFIAFISARHLLRNHFNAQNNLFLFLCGIFYAFSPVMLTEFIGGTQYSTMLIFAAFPLLASLSLDVFLEFSFRKFVKLLLLFSILLAIDIHLIVIYAIFVGTILLSLLLSKKNFIKPTITFVILIFLSLLSNPIYNLNNFNILHSNSGMEEGIAGFLSNLVVFINDVTYTYSRSTLLNTIRLGGNLSSFDYVRLHWWNIPFLLVSIITLGYSIYLSIKGNIKQRIFALGYILITLFIYGTYLKLTYPVFKHFPMLFIFRNPAKLTALNILFFYVCFFITFSQSIFNKRKFLSILLSVSTIIYIWPIFLGDRGLSMSRVSYSIPKEYYTIVQTIKDDATKMNVPEYRTMWLPSNYEQHSIKLIWLDRVRVEDQLGLSDFSTDYFGGYVVNAITQAVTQKDVVVLKKLLASVNIKYLILTKDTVGSASIKTFYNSVSLNSGYSLVNDLLKDNKVVYESDDFKVYSMEVTPDKVYGVNEVNSVGYSLRDSSFLLFDYYKHYSLPLVKSVDNNNDILVAKLRDNDISNLIFEWDPLWAWPDPEIKPTSFAYYLVILKEKIALAIRPATISKVNYSVWTLSRRSVELSRFTLSDELRQKFLSVLMNDVKTIKDYYENTTLLKNDFERDSALKSYIYLNRSYYLLTQFMSPTDIENYKNLLILIRTKIDNSYAGLCIENCVVASSKTDQNYKSLIDVNSKYSLKVGNTILSQFKPSTITFSKLEITPPKTQVYEIIGLPESGSGKYMLEFRYNTNSDIYKFNIFSNYKMPGDLSYKPGKYDEYTLTPVNYLIGVTEPNKIFRYYFEPKIHKNIRFYLTFENLNPLSQNKIDISDLSITPTFGYKLSLIKDNVQLNSTSVSNVPLSFVKKTPNEYSIEASSLNNSGVNYLIFTNSYHSGWKVFNDKDKEIFANTHQLTLGYANIWKINSSELDNTSVIKIKFTPQDDLIKSLVWSSLFLGLFATYLIATHKKR